MKSPRKAAAAATGGDAVDLYELRRKVYPRAVTGWFAGWRWVMVWLTQLVFYGLPWLQWNGRQAVLFDLESRRFFIFGLVLHPQDFIYLTGLLVISAMSLFLFTTIAGRLWCGYACPQTVYTEIFLWIERRIEGDRFKRMKLDAAPMSARKLGLKAAKHGVWILFSLWTGFTFVGYFTPILELGGLVATAALGPWQTFWILFYGFATYGNAGFMREQVCKYMCPYARFQGVMFDRDTLIITYDAGRGEPRGSRSRKADPSVLGLGSCIDCGLCVEVCPTGIDIREGLQAECIGCAACIDACDAVMGKMSYPPGLIRYDTENGTQNRWSRAQLWRRVVRPRVLVYTAVLLAATIALVAHMATRTPLKLDVIRDRGTLGREVDDGMIENVYRLQVVNSTEEPRSYVLSVSGIETVFIDSQTEFDVEAAGNRMVPVRVRILPDAGEPGTHTIYFGVTDLDDPDVSVNEKATFYVPFQAR
ncbi:MAG: cytochrome c oxidase accessory protein CcoG [Burkholderiaceae bacterium]|nr:cytochrome c oxidase accessory protein CcoG [Burkholderiaceae bacterium]